MKNYGYKKSDSNYTLFLKHNQGNIPALIIYVDDMIITENDKYEMMDLEERLSKKFEMKKLGGLKYFFWN
jgi:Reverse transcriptase (RNA-dependent DNA polymerase)